MREDSRSRGLLFAGTERTVHVSSDDGASWHSLQGDLPSTSIRDLVVHGDDLVVGTHGRAFWILDDIAPLRERRIATTQLYRPARAIRVRRDTWSDTPLPPDEPVGENPPDGAILDYTIAPGDAGAVKIEVLEFARHVVRAFASTDSQEPIDPDTNIPTFWIRPTAIPPATPGDHRFVWDLREAAPHAVERSFPIGAIAHKTPHAPEGIIVVPGSYMVRMTVGNRISTQPLELVMDPRVTTPVAMLREQHDLESRIVASMNRTYAAMERATLAKDAGAASRYAARNGKLAQLLGVVTSADARPTAAMYAAYDSVGTAMR